MQTIYIFLPQYKLKIIILTVNDDISKLKVYMHNLCRLILHEFFVHKKKKKANTFFLDAYIQVVVIFCVKNYKIDHSNNMATLNTDVLYRM